MNILDKLGFKKLLELLKQKLASFKQVESIDINTKTYVTEIDYETELAFNTNYLVNLNADVATTGTAVCGMAVVGNS